MEQGWRWATLACISVIWCGACQPSSTHVSFDVNGKHMDLSEASVQQIRQFCGDCHVMPRPESFPRDAWHDEVLRGYEFYAESGRHDLAIPPIAESIAYFRSRAPEKLQLPTPPPIGGDSAVRFRMQTLTLQHQQYLPPAISHLSWRAKPESERRLWACDMRRGELSFLSSLSQEAEPRTISGLHHPSHIEFADLDGDGHDEVVIADLGSFDPADHQRGRVLWLGRDAEAREPLVLAEKFGRVADVRAADFDGDGDRDLIVAEFGLRQTGGILLLQNQGGPPGRPSFEPRYLDRRPGTIHLPVVDLDADGRPDFLALISQQFEEITAFLNRGSGNFEKRLLWQAPDPAWGASGIQVVDLDRDNDLDILHTNGDTFDSLNPKPYHGIQWLENLGDLEFRHHRLCDLPGAYSARAGDLDLDGDTDITAVAWLPRTVAEGTNWTSILWLEQQSPNRFLRHEVEQGQPHYPASLLADFDADGDLDLAVGWHLAHTRASKNWLSILWNER